MQLTDLKPAWKQFKIQNNLRELDASEILSMIEKSEPARPHQLLIKTIVFLVITFCCVGG